MSRYYSWTDIHVIPDDLIAFAWSAPMRDLAAEIGLSDVGLRKLLVSYGVAPPPQGYWNKLRAGRPVPQPPKVPPRGPGETGRVRVDNRFAQFIPAAEPMSSAGPFASSKVPEDLEELRTKELAALGRVAVPKSLDEADPGLRDLLAREQRQKAKQAQSGWAWDAPKFDTPLDRRKLRLLNAICIALRKRGHKGSASDHDDVISGHAAVGDTGVGLKFGPVGKHRATVQRGFQKPAPDLPATTPLSIAVEEGVDGVSSESWADDDDGKLESKIARITASIIVSGEAKFRRGLRLAEERREQERIAAEARRREQLAALNRKRVEDLHGSGELFRRSQEIRAIVSELRRAIEAGTRQVEPATLQAWTDWALAEADKLDPIVSGHFLSHLEPPRLD